MRASTVASATLFGPLLADRTPGHDAGRDPGEKSGQDGAMAIIRTVLWSLAKRAAANPRVRKKAGQAILTVDRKMDKAADKVAEVATAKDPAREAGKMLGAFFSGEQRPKR